MRPERIYRLSLLLLLWICALDLAAQTGVQGVIVEEVFTQPGNALEGIDQNDSSIYTTYRVFIDLEEGYRLQAVFGNMEHPLVIRSTGNFYNYPEIGVTTGNMIDPRKMFTCDLKYDSFLTLNAVSNWYCGSPQITTKQLHKIETDTLGVLAECEPTPLQLIRIEADAFKNNTVEGEFYTNDGCWAVLGGVVGPDPSNRILVAQITTNGELSFELNVQLGLPQGGAQQYVARAKNTNEEERKGLVYPPERSTSKVLNQ